MVSTEMGAGEPKVLTGCYQGKVAVQQPVTCLDGAKDHLPLRVQRTQERGGHTGQVRVQHVAWEQQLRRERPVCRPSFEHSSQGPRA